MFETRIILYLETYNYIRRLWKKKLMGFNNQLIKLVQAPLRNVTENLILHFLLFQICILRLPLKRFLDSLISMHYIGIVRQDSGTTFL